MGDEECMKPYSLGLYEKAMPNWLSLPEKLDLTAKCGFDRMEISVDESDEKLARLDYTEKQMLQLVQASQDAGIPISTMCLSAHRKYPMGSHDPATVKRSMEILEKALYFGGVIGVKLIQLAGYDVYYEDHDEGTEAQFRENLAKAVDMAATSGITLGFETMETPFMDTTRKAMHYVDLIRSPYLGIYPDIGNLKNAAVLYGNDVKEDIHTGAGHIFAAHLKETRPGVYRDMTFGSGHTEYGRCIEELWRQGVRMYTGEFWYRASETYEQDIQDAHRFLRGILAPVANQHIQ